MLQPLQCHPTQKKFARGKIRIGRENILPLVFKISYFVRFTKTNDLVNTLVGTRKEPVQARALRPNFYWLWVNLPLLFICKALVELILFSISKIYFIDYAIIVVPVFLLCAPPPGTPISSGNPPLVHGHGPCI